MADDRTRDDNSRYTTEYTDSDFLEAIDELGKASTSDIATEIGCATATAHYRLNKLEDNETIQSEKKYGAVLWQRTD